MQIESHVEIGLLCFLGHQATTVHGLTDLFSYANHFAREHGLDGPTLRVRHWHHGPGSAAPDCGFDNHPGLGGSPAVVIVPASQLAPMAAGSARSMAEPDTRTA